MSAHTHSHSLYHCSEQPRDTPGAPNLSQFLTSARNKEARGKS